MKKALLYIGLAYLGYKLFYPDDTVVIIDENQLPVIPRQPGDVVQQFQNPGNLSPTSQPIQYN